MGLMPMAVPVDDALLQRWPLPLPAVSGDKETRGSVLVVAGSRETPGAALLAGMAALRAGAGKLVIATAASVAPGVALAIPEARVVALAETGAGAIAAGAAETLYKAAREAESVVIGPGMVDERATGEFVQLLLPHLGHAGVLLDALAMGAVRNAGEHARRRVALTPHVGELAQLLAREKSDVICNAGSIASAAALEWNAVVALKGAVTTIASPDGRLWKHEGGNIGLAVSGSGDTLAGIIAGLMARGAPLEQSCVWGVLLHSLAGDRLAARQGMLGYLAREIAAEIPALMRELAPRA